MDSLKDETEMVEPLVYQRKWDKAYDRENSSLKLEWHCTTEILMPYLAPYLRAVKENLDEQSSTLVDCGCGGSSIGVDLSEELGLMHCLLLDISPVCAESMDTKYKRNSIPLVSVVLADCRQMPIPEHSVSVMVDKGTLDALESQSDITRTMQEFARVISLSHGLLVAVSFGAPHRLRLFAEEMPKLGLKYDVHIIGEGDPAFGNEVRFLVCAYHSSASPVFDGLYEPSELTTMLLDRVARTSSVMDDGEPNAFGASDEDDY